ncbi:hypothetical protein PIB30_022240 [Stylosanthes scabra]|uniref:Uncharacterized protein n=1 Tax=Stylosanthes scabra TaxID=79078 RepID=A0ABU6R9D3_9FABA|nr:hypothetical protein [Stylosanthes scabra]
MNNNNNNNNNNNFQVSNWFINARVRLWKPMVEEMYQQELKEAEECGGVAEDEEEEDDQEDEEKEKHSHQQQQQTGSTTAPPPPSSTNNNNGDESEIQVEGFSENQEGSNSMMVAQGGMGSEMQPQPQPQPPHSQSQRSMASDDTCRHGSYVAGAEYGTASAAAAADIGSATLIRFGTTAGDVSLTLGLRHAGNVVNMPPRQNPFFS